jgi:hypothetical protein
MRALNNHSRVMSDVRHGSNFEKTNFIIIGQTWPSCGQTVAKLWPNCGQTVARLTMNHYKQI